MAVKIFVGNYKGGVGKTTSVYHISQLIPTIQEGKKVLMIDLDPQCSLSEICMTRIHKNLGNLDDNESLNFVYEAYFKKMTKYNNINIQLDKNRLIKRVSDNVYFIPSNLFHKKGDLGLDALNAVLQKSDNSVFILDQFFRDSKINEEFDYIIFDCPPANNTITQSAFLISDYYLIPTIMDNVSTRGVIHYIKAVDKIYTSYCENHNDSEFMKAVFQDKPLLLGIFETLYKYNVKNEDVKQNLGVELTKSLENLEKEVSQELHIKNKMIFKSTISNYVDIARSTATGYIHSKAEGYKDLTKEILERINEFEKKR